MIKVGILAEDSSDVGVITELIKKFVSPKKFCVRHFASDGCGKLKSKCLAWSQQLQLKGCSVLMLIHDLDKKNLRQLRQDLTTAMSNCPISKHAIIIPIEEIEAWLMTDPVAIQKSFSLKKTPNLSGNPENIISPKEKLDALVWRLSGKTRRYLNTAHNSVIAKHTSVINLRKCSAFHDFERFVLSHIR